MPVALTAPRRRLNPELLDAVNRSGVVKHQLSFTVGFPHYIQFFRLLNATEPIAATPLTILRLQRVAHAVGFPCEQIFLDEVSVESQP